jgi:hypothetical protein
MGYSIARLVLVKLFGTENVLLHLVVGCLAGLFIPLVVQKVMVYLHLNFLLRPPSSLRASRQMERYLSTRAV